MTNTMTAANYNHDKGLETRCAPGMFINIFFYFTDCYTFLIFTDSLVVRLRLGTTTWGKFFLFLLISLITIYRIYAHHLDKGPGDGRRLLGHK